MAGGGAVGPDRGSRVELRLEGPLVGKFAFARITVRVSGSGAPNGAPPA